MSNSKFIIKNYNGTSWDELYPKTQGDNVIMTNYSKALLASSVAVTDTAGEAIGKLEKALDGKQETLAYTAENIANKGVANGYAGLGGDGKVPSSQLPSTVAGGMSYKGTWDASTGTYPTPATTGDYYIVTVAGMVSSIDYQVKDWATYNGTSWDKIDNTDSIASVNTKTGVVVLSGADILATGYTKAVSVAPVASSDSLNVAIGKVEKALDAKQASGNYVAANNNITAGTNTTKISFDTKGLVTGGSSANANDFAMTGYVKSASIADVTTTDSINLAIGKVEKKVDSKLSPNAAITGATKTKITYDTNGLVKAGADAVATDFLMAGYAKATTAANVLTSDSISVALGKVEKKVDNRPMFYTQSTQPTAQTSDFWFQII